MESDPHCSASFNHGTVASYAHVGSLVCLFFCVLALVRTLVNFQLSFSDILKILEALRTLASTIPLADCYDNVRDVKTKRSSWQITLPIK